MKRCFGWVGHEFGQELVGEGVHNGVGRYCEVVLLCGLPWHRLLMGSQSRGGRGGRGIRYGVMGGSGGYRGVHYAGAVRRDHSVVVRGSSWVDLVRDARGEAGVKDAERVSELCVDFIDAYVEDGMESCEKSIGEVLDGGVERVG